jgi:hypothetical protein
MAAVTIDQLVKDARSGVRVVRRDPCATAVAVLSLALSMGANTAVFSIAHAYFLRDWRVRNPQELVFVRARASTDERIGGFP